MLLNHLLMVVGVSMKYVAFLDILGFKEKLKLLNQEEAKKFISEFSSTAYIEWEKLSKKNLEGYIVSDSFVIYTSNTSASALKELITMVSTICKKEFSKNGLLIRGGIAKGEFDNLQAKELSNLKKGLMVGQAYIDAYLLESKIKTAGITLSNTVCEDINNSYGNINDIVTYSEKKENFYVLRYLSIDFLMDIENLRNYIELAKKSQWLPHYYNTLYLALHNENNEKKVNQLFLNIFDLIAEEKNIGNWRDVDLFIKNSFSNDVNSNYQTRFLKHLRSKLFSG